MALKKKKTSKKNSSSSKTTHREVLEEIIRVDHAGEYGATKIYDGQIAIFGKNSKLGKTIQHMADQEQEHIDKFNELILEHRVRPTALLPLWNVAGYALGASTALMGEKAAMACTVAVEKVIGEHYKEQLDLLGDDHKDLKKTISKFRDDELEHRVRPTALLPLWNVAGFGLGTFTALMGEKAAMACTVAVEKVIGEHYQEQLDLLGDDHKDLKKTISKFRDDELEHHDIGIEHDAESATGYKIMSKVIELGCKTAIAISKKI